MKKCIFYTYAYNAENTIARSVESVLAQSRPDWVWYLLDNGSTDGTYNIISQYASKDSRIIALRNKENHVMLRNKENHVYESGNDWTEIIENYDDSDYLCLLDADDEYKPEFLTKMIRFISDYDLEIAVCGYDFIDDTTKNMISERRLEQDLILDSPELFDIHFCSYYMFMRTAWCKLYKVSVLRRYDHSRVPSLHHYGIDTLFALENFRNAGRVGILAESLHNYYVYPQSASYRLDDTRIICDRTLDDASRAFLIDKCGVISPRNNLGLQYVYFYGIIDTITILIQTDLPYNKKLQSLSDLLTNSKTREMIRQIDMSEEHLDLLLRFPVFKWLIKQKEYRNPKSVDKIVEILIAIYPKLSVPTRKKALRHLLMESPEKLLE